MVDIKYVGEELEIFALARQWKNYYGALIKPYFGESVLEVGAGIGTTASVLYIPQVKRWICLEPDMEFVKILNQKIKDKVLPSACLERLGTLLQLEKDSLFDCVLYIDVLEHIDDDRAELNSASRHLKPGGHLIVLSPAHQWLFTPFDQAIGHFRRYSKASLARLRPDNCSLEKLMYLDSVGMFLSLANKFLLRQSMPTAQQILFWDRYIVPLSKLLDRILFFNFGKSIVAVWKNEI